MTITIFGFIILLVFAGLIGGAVGYQIARKKYYTPDKNSKSSGGGYIPNDGIDQQKRD